jgi:hypothetical protein
MALAVGNANSEAEFVFPTSEEMGHLLSNNSEVQAGGRFNQGVLDA